VCLHQLERFKEAITEFEIAKDIYSETADPFAAYVALCLGRCFMQLEEHEDALKNHKESIERRQQSSSDLKTDTELASFHFYVGLCLYQLERLKEAIADFEIAKDIYTEIDDPKVEDVAVCLGHCFTQLETHEEDLKNYKESIERRQHLSNELKTDSELASFHSYAGACLFQLERFKEAITEFEIAKDIYNEIDDPLPASVANCLGKCFKQLEEHEDAVKNW